MSKRGKVSNIPTEMIIIIVIIVVAICLFVKWIQTPCPAVTQLLPEGVNIHYIPRISDVKIPKFKVPDVKMPKIKVPNVHLPKIKVPEHPEVFWIRPSNIKASDDTINEVCANVGAVPATSVQLQNALLAGANWCQYGVSEDTSNSGNVYNIVSGQLISQNPQCGGSTGVGHQRIADSSPTTGYLCYGDKPSPQKYGIAGGDTDYIGILPYSQVSGKWSLYNEDNVMSVYNFLRKRL